MDGSTVLKVADGVLTRMAGSEMVLLDLDSEEFFGLDGVGARVFELLEQPQRFDDVLGTLLREYDVDRETLTADVNALVADLVARNLLAIVTPPPG
ncbi:MAG TPA: PqqD family protein [Aeromicrobium sp.]|nr:PqqD family protein [Aeromicrobium sp.]